MISAFDIFKPGIGPSSSHTVGPMNAGKRFIDQLVSMGDIAPITRIVVDLYGSLSLTGKGHATPMSRLLWDWRETARKMSILTACRHLFSR